jgi:hypothetical protein
MRGLDDSKVYRLVDGVLEEKFLERGLFLIAEVLGVHACLFQFVDVDGGLVFFVDDELRDVGGGDGVECGF